MDSAREPHSEVVEVRIVCTGLHTFTRNCVQESDTNVINLPTDMPVCPTCGSEWQEVKIGGKP